MERDKKWCPFCLKKVDTYLKATIMTASNKVKNIEYFKKHRHPRRFITGELVWCFKSNQPI